ncbi:MAK10-like protein [Tanacetum coccineum]
MGDENPIRTLGDYSKPSHEGYRNTIELLVGNNVVPLRSDTIRLVQNGCSFYEIRSEDPNQHLKDFLKLVDSLDLNGANRERMRLGPVYEAILKKKITKKEDIRGNFEVPCNIGGLKNMNALVDQGSDDVLVDVASYVYPVDFFILDIKENEERPFILGTPFLTTAKAVIKFDKGTITLKFGWNKISFHRILESPCKSEKRIKIDVEPIAPIMTVNRLVLEWEEKIKLNKEKEMEFNRWRNKNFKNERLALVKIGNKKDDEGEVT